MISRMDCKKRMNFAYVLKFLAVYFYFPFHNKQKQTKSNIFISENDIEKLDKCSERLMTW